MNYNNDTGLIDTILSLDTTEAPPVSAVGYQTNVLWVQGTGALTLPQGDTSQQPGTTTGTAFAGMLRYNTAGYLEFYDGITSSWQTLSYAAGTVASVSLNTVTGTDATIITVTPTSASTGAVAETITFNSQAANLVFAGPTTGTAQPSFRALVAGDIPPVTNIAGGATGDIVYQTGANTTGFIAPGTAGTVLTSNGTGNAPSYTAVVNSFSAGTTGLTPNTASTGAVTLAGILNLASGGTNFANTGSNGSIMYNNGTAIVNSTVGANNQALLSTGAGAPTWLTVASTITTNQILQGDGSGAFTANGATFVGSPTFSGVTLSGTVTNATDAVTKAYADGLINGLSWKQAVVAATTTDLGSVTYVNGTAGVGATLTNAGTQAAFTIDGITPTVGQRVLIKNETNQTYNGIYTVTNAGSGSTNWVLTRSLDNNTGTEMDGAAAFVEEGTLNATTSWVQQTPTPITIGTSNIVWVQFSGQGTYSAGAGLSLSGGQFSVKTDAVTTYINGSSQVAVLSSSVLDQVLLSQGAGNTAQWGAVQLGNTNSVTGTLAVSNGGTGTTSFTLDGVLYGNGTSAIQSTAAGTNGQVLTVVGGVPTWGTPSISLAADASSGSVSLGGTLTVDGTANRISTTVTGSTFAVNISSSYVGQSSITTLGTVTTGTWNATPIGPTYGGTGQSTYTVGATLYADTTTSLAQLPIGTTGQVLTVSAGGIPSWTTIATEAVTTFQTSLSGLTPQTPTNGAVTLAGVLGVASGGTGDTSLTSNGVLFGNGTSPVGVTGAGAQYNVLTVNGAGIPVLSTINLASSAAVGTSILQPANGGTGVANTNTITLGGNIVTAGSFTTSGAFPLTLTTTGATNVTLPTTGTLLTAADAVTSFDLTDTSTTPIYTTFPTSPTVGAVASTITLNTQLHGTVFAGNATTDGVQPTFRRLVYSDVVGTGAALQLYAEAPSSPIVAIATGAEAVALGSGSLASQYGSLVHASGDFATSGDAQAGEYILRGTTTNATPTELFLDGSSLEFTLPTNSVVTFSILVSARRTDATGFGGGFEVKGVAHKDTTAASVALIGATSTTVIGRNPSTLTVAVTPNTVTGGLKVTVTGVAASTYRWVAVMKTSEVTN